MNQPPYILTENEIKQVQTLCEEHFNVGIINGRFYTYTSFDPSSAASAGSIDFCTLRAVDITPFVKLDRISVGRSGYLNEFRRYMEKNIYLQYRINKTMDYTLISLI